MTKDKFNILLAEDDPNLGMLLKGYLAGEGFGVTLCEDGERAKDAFRPGAFHICLLDVMMPKMDGFTLAGIIRALDPQIPILFITARSLRDDRKKGYATGADDYILKPFDEEELVWKIRAMLRRSGAMPSGPAEQVIDIGTFRFDVANQSLEHDGSLRRITEKETAILQYLCSHRNRVVRRDDLVEALWGRNDYFLGRSLDVFITKFRKYLAADPEIRIENVFGVGFIFTVPE